MRQSAWVGRARACPAIAIAGPVAAQPPAGVNPTGAAVLVSSSGVAEYVKVHKQADGQVPSLAETSDPAKIAHREVALGEAIRRLRVGRKAWRRLLRSVRPVLIKVDSRGFREALGDRSQGARSRSCRRT